MQDTNIWKEISNIKNRRRRFYFMYKNNIENIRLDWGALTEEEFIKRCNGAGKDITNTEFFLNHMVRWESSAEYKRLLFLLKEDSFATDLIDVYENTKELAKQGDSQSIKNMLLLQKEIKKYRKSIDSFQEVEELEEGEDLII